jgi:hypothetical protein
MTPSVATFFFDVDVKLGISCQMDAKCPQCRDEENQWEIGFVTRQQATAYYCKVCRNLYYIESEGDLPDDDPFCHDAGAQD